MAYDPKRSRGRATAKHVIEQDEPAPVDGLLDGRIEVPEWADEATTAIEPVAAPDGGAPVVEPVAAEPAPEEPEPAVEGPAVEGPAVEEPVTEAVVEEPAGPVEPAPAPAAARAPAPRSEPPVAPVPDTPGSRWLFVAFLVAVLSVIVWQLRRRSHR